MKKTIKVTKAHIRDGERGSVCNCPFALAIKDQMLTSNVEVGSESLLVNGLSFELSAKERQWIRRYDERGKVKPFTLVLDTSR